MTGNRLQLLVSVLVQGSLFLIKSSRRHYSYRLTLVVNQGCLEWAFLNPACVAVTIIPHSETSVVCIFRRLGTRSCFPSVESVGGKFFLAWGLAYLILGYVVF